MNKMQAFVLLLLGTSFLAYSQQSFVEQSLVLNVEVPVRVFKGATFVADLTINDFEILEDGVPQKIEACYLINKSAIQRREEIKRYIPQTTRNFYLFFEITDYVPKIGDAVNYFCQNILIPTDNLMVITPLKTYRLKEQALQGKSKEAIAEELKELVRKDCLAGNAEFRNAVSDLTGLAKSLSAAIKTGAVDVDANPVKEQDGAAPVGIQGMQLDEQLVLYGNLLEKLETLREISQMKLLDFADHLARQDGQKYVFLFYQREFIPQVDPKLVMEYSALYQDNPYVYQTLTQTAKLRDRDMSFDVERVKQTYADASTAIHFLFITTPRPEISGVYFEERSEDIFSAFREMAEATGGIFESSANPASMFQNALEATENYYLLYYSPKKVEDTERNFRQIEVRVKKGDYRILYRAGYFLH